VVEHPERRVAWSWLRKVNCGEPNVEIDQTRADAGPMIVLKDSSWKLPAIGWTSRRFN